MRASGDFALARGENHDELMALLAESDLHPDRFYLTGFETFTFNRDLSFAIETVLSSVMSMDRTLLIVGQELLSVPLRRLCDKQAIDYHWLETGHAIDNFNELKQAITYPSSVSHLLVLDNETVQFSDEMMRQIGVIAGVMKADLIVVSRLSRFTVAKATSCNISFLIGSDPQPKQQTTILAKRSKLVQTEGVSRHFLFDLYGYWQEILNQRNHRIEPMAV